MNTAPSFKEDHISQLPALQLLQKLGYTYLTPADASKARVGKTSNVILDAILEERLRALNKIKFKGGEHQFADSNIKAAIQALKEVPFDGLVRTNEKLYDLLTLGKSFDQTIDGDTKSFDLNYIDWKALENNRFHVTEEFEVACTASHQTKRPDLVLFVNGIPFAVIECKRPDIENPIEQAISQQVRNQRVDEIPRLFVFAQILLAVSANEAKYATVGTSAKFWAIWKEKEPQEEALEKLVNSPLSADQKTKLFSDRFRYVREHFDQLESQRRFVTEQDRTLFYLCRPERLLELTQKFLVFDAGEKKLARYQQYFAVKATLERIRNLNGDGKRTGGVIWHTQGSGKSLTMVMLAKCIALDKEIVDPKIIIVTDRVDLDKQIHKTFLHCGKEPKRADTGNHLLKLIEEKKETIITTVINKFEAALNRKSFQNASPNIFCLVDEGHRTQYGSLNVKMQQVFPKACYIAFTGTPLLKEDKTSLRFGGFIDSYTIRQAVNDKAVVPLKYEGRHVLQEVQHRTIDSWFERVTQGLTDEQRKDLKRKFSTANQLNKTDQKVQRIAYDIWDHFKKNVQGKGFKAQLAAPDKLTAIKYKRFLDEYGGVTSEVVISPPDQREGYDDTLEDTKEEVVAYHKKMIEKYGQPRPAENTGYPFSVIECFKTSEEPEIIIVVSMLLVGFDAPRNTFLYVCRGFKEHALLQAIARVNRLYEGKDFGFIIDYYGILGDLDKALTEYSEAGLDKFDPDDIAEALENINEEVEKLPPAHRAVWELFESIQNKLDAEAFQQLLADKALRDQFYERLTIFAKALEVALSTVKFVTETPKEKLATYERDLAFFHNLRSAVQQRYAEKIDYKQYEARVQKLLNTYVTADELQQLTPLVNIFDEEAFSKAVEEVHGSAAKADMIAHQTKKTVTDKMDEDPAFYGKFSRLLEQAINDYRKKRLSELEYLRLVAGYREAVRNNSDSDIPQKVRGYDGARAFYGVVADVLAPYGNNESRTKELAADVGLEVDEIVRKTKIIDWVINKDIQNQMTNQIEDCLFELKKKAGISLEMKDIDAILERCLNVAKTRYPQ